MKFNKFTGLRCTEEFYNIDYIVADAQDGIVYTDYDKIPNELKDYLDSAEYMIDYYMCCCRLFTLENIRYQTPNMVSSAINLCGTDIQYALVKTDSDFLNSLDNGGSLKYFKTDNYEILKKAIEHSPYNIEYVKDKTDELCMLAVKDDGLTIQYIDNPNYDLQYEAVKSDGVSIVFIDNPSEELLKLAVSYSEEIIKFINNPSKELLAYYDELAEDGSFRIYE